MSRPTEHRPLRTSCRDAASRRHANSFGVLALAAAAALAACSTKHVSLSGDVKLKAAAQENYEAGVELLEDDSYPEAIKFFEFVKKRFPFSKYAPLSELRLADAKFKQGEFSSAAEAYAEFVKLHPAHEEVDYAEYRIALSRYRDAPGDFFLFPPSYEKDAREVVKARDALEKFLKAHPSSKHAAEATKLLGTVNQRLAAHEWYVGEYYFKRRRWAGAAGRYETLVEKYPGSRQEPEALLKLARAYLAMDEKHRARSALQKLVVKHPQDPHRKEAEGLLASLR
jgi:outer membrane protein assembly factor BamD